LAANSSGRDVGFELRDRIADVLIMVAHHVAQRDPAAPVITIVTQPPSSNFSVTVSIRMSAVNKHPTPIDRELAPPSFGSRARALATQLHAHPELRESVNVTKHVDRVEHDQQN